ncbi:chaplin family protein [Streptomyces sp. NPDC091272]|uniref:chaplin n=1 Tax=Streptomyces sp. NPDC091272 TaxID=3365981 RepID=UPI0037FBD754
MRQVTTKGLITIAAAGGVLALSGGAAHADSGADGNASNSPGVLSGNSVQVPVHVPVNACGNSVSVVGVLNPAFGNACVNKSEPAKKSHPDRSGRPGHPGSAAPGTGTHTHTGGGASAHGDTGNSPGVGSGNNIKVPVDIPVNACGNSVSVVGLLNPVFGNDCDNEPQPPRKPHQPGNPGEPHTPGEPQEPPTPGKPHTPAVPHTPAAPPTRAIPNVPLAQTVAQPKATETLAQTGASGSLGTVIPAGAGLLLTGAVLYRRARSAA